MTRETDTAQDTARMDADLFAQAEADRDAAIAKADASVQRDQQAELVVERVTQFSQDTRYLVSTDFGDGRTKTYSVRSSLDIDGFLPIVLLTKDGRQVLLHDETAVQAVLEYADDRVRKAIAAYAEVVAQNTTRDEVTP